MPELVLYGTVGMSLWDEPHFTPLDVRRQLAEMSGPVTVRLNSGGGVAADGLAIYQMLRDYPDEVTVIVDAVAASAASLLAMGADRIVMRRGAWMLIHDPASWWTEGRGTEDDHAKMAQHLGKLALGFAEVYADRTGLSVDEAREIMRVETTYMGREAVDAGFADAFEDEQADEPVAFDYRIYAHAPESARRASERLGGAPAREAVMAMFAGDARPPRSKEDAMSGDPKKAAAPAASAETKPSVQMQNGSGATASISAHPPASKPAEAATPAATAAVDAEAVRAEERVRVRRIMDITAMAGMPHLATEMIDAGMSSDAALDAVLKRKKEADMAIGDTGRPRAAATVTSDEGERKVEAIIGALSARMFGRPLEGAAQEYRGISFRTLAMDLSNRRGYAFSDADRVREGMMTRGVLMASGAHSVSDFGYITGQVMNRELQRAYSERPGTWSRISAGRSAADFRTLYAVQAGVDTEMRAITENGEYQSTVLTDRGESFQVERYGRKVNITFEAVINDDLGAFARLPADFARGARNLESRICWALIVANGNMSDGEALFAAGHGNLAGSGGALSADTVGAARKAMWEQRPLGASATGDDFIMAEPDLLFVPPALEIDALQFTAATIPVKDSETNPYKGTLTAVVEPRLGAAVSGGSDTAWYLFDSRIPTLQHAYLDGYAAPTVQSIDRMDPDGVTLIARHIFGAGVAEFVGAYKNAGA